MNDASEPDYALLDRLGLAEHAFHPRADAGGPARARPTT